jgi:hypothetical protein
MSQPLRTARQLLAEMHRAGAVLRVIRDRLAFDAPAGAMTSAIRSMLKERKPELLAVLNGE